MAQHHPGVQRHPAALGREHLRHLRHLLCDQTTPWGARGGPHRALRPQHGDYSGPTATREQLLVRSGRWWRSSRDPGRPHVGCWGTRTTTGWCGVSAETEDLSRGRGRCGAAPPPLLPLRGGGGSPIKEIDRDRPVAMANGRSPSTWTINREEGDNLDIFRLQGVTRGDLLRDLIPSGWKDTMGIPVVSPSWAAASMPSRMREDQETRRSTHRPVAGDLRAVRPGKGRVGNAIGGDDLPVDGRLVDSSAQEDRLDIQGHRNASCPTTPTRKDLGAQREQQ